MSHLLWRRWFHSLQRIRNAQFLPFINAQSVIGKHFHTLHIVERGNEIMQTMELSIIVGDARHEHMTNPNWHLPLAQLPSTIEYILIRSSRQPFVRLIIDVLDIKKHFVRKFHQFVKLTEPRFFTCEILCGSIKTSVDISLLRLLEKFQEKVDLQKGFSPTDGDASILTPITTIAFCLVQNSISSPLLCTFHRPCIRIVAILTAHPTAFHENKKSNPWTIN